MVKQINNTIRSIVIDYDSKIALFKTYPTIITKEKDTQCSFEKLEFLSSEFGVFRKNLFSGWEIVCGKNRLRYVFDFYDDIQKEEIFNLRNLD